MGQCLSDASRLYRLLFARSVLVAGAVYGALALIGVVHHLVAASSAAARLVALVEFLLSLAGPAIVQGAVVELVGNVHDGRPPRPVGAVLRLGRDRVFPLLGALLFYGFGVAIGLLLLIVPGLVIAARWSLLVPVIILEERGLAEARDRSTKLVQEHTGRVLAVVVSSFLLVVWPFAIVWFLVDDFWLRTLIGAVASTLTAPFIAEVGAVLYYRLTDPDRPSIPWAESVQ